MRVLNFRKIKYRSYYRISLIKPLPIIKKRVLFIMNPISGEKMTRWINSQGLKILRRRLLHIDVIKTQHAGHAQQIVEENLNNYDIFFAVGGDGTANEVAGKLIGTDKIFSILPSGSGNGCARELKLPSLGFKLIHLLVKGKTTKMDVLYVNDKHSINVSGVGYDATIAERFHRRESRGLFNYAQLILRSYFNYKPLNYHFFVDGKEVKTKAFLISFANTRQFGNNAYIAPQAKHNDGWMELVVVQPFPKWYALHFALLVMTKQINRSRYVTSYHCKEVVFDLPNTRWYHIDGDPVKLRGPVTITVKPGALNVFDTHRHIYSLR